MWLWMYLFLYSKTLTMRNVRPSAIVPTRYQIGAPAPSGLCRADGHCHRQAAGDQDDRVEAAEPDVELEAAFGPRVRVPHSINQIRREEAAEEHHLGDKEDPHPEGRRLELLLHRIELVLVRRMMGVRVPMLVGVCGDPVRQL